MAVKDLTEIPDECTCTWEFTRKDAADVFSLTDPEHDCEVLEHRELYERVYRGDPT